jgi:hypothetical protein
VAEEIRRNQKNLIGICTGEFDSIFIGICTGEFDRNCQKKSEEFDRNLYWRISEDLRRHIICSRKVHVFLMSACN